MFSQENLIIPLCVDATSVTSNVEMDSFSMEGYNQATILIVHSAALTGNSILTVECASTDSGDSSDATFHYRYGGAAAASASADILSADATSSALTLTAATYQGRLIVLELLASELPVSGSTVYENVTVDWDGTASAGTVTAIAILSQPRHSRAVMPTAIPTS